jgi:hypothetical protein
VDGLDWTGVDDLARVVAVEVDGEFARVAHRLERIDGPSKSSRATRLSALPPSWHEPARPRLAQSAESAGVSEVGQDESTVVNATLWMMNVNRQRTDTDGDTPGSPRIASSALRGRRWRAPIPRPNRVDRRVKASSARDAPTSTTGAVRTSFLSFTTGHQIMAPSRSKKHSSSEQFRLRFVSLGAVSCPYSVKKWSAYGHAPTGVSLPSSREVDLHSGACPHTLITEGDRWSATRSDR